MMLRRVSLGRIAPLVWAGGLVLLGTAWATSGPGFGPVAKLLAPDGVSLQGFGQSVSVDDATAVIGAQSDDDLGDQAGAAYVFGRDVGGPGNWGFVIKLLAPDGQAYFNFGSGASLEGDTALVGAKEARDDLGNNRGAAYVFGRDVGGPDSWGAVAKLEAPDADTWSFFGNSVSLSGATALVGAGLDDDLGFHSGSAYLFKRDVGGADNWGFVAKLLAPDGLPEDHFGSAVSLSGDTALAGAEWHDHNGTDSGAAYLFGRDEGGTDNWGLVAKLLAPDGAAGDAFGNSVALDGDIAVVGAWTTLGTPRPGAAYVFGRDVGGRDNWGFVAKLLAPDGASEDRFGRSVSIDGATAVVSAHLHDEPRPGAGAAYVFRRDMGGPNQWGFVAKLVAPDAGEDYWVGLEVSLSDGTALLGALGPGGLKDPGSAYVFRETLVDPLLDIAGSCPGRVDVSVQGITPYGRVAVAWGAGQGSTPVPVGLCQGTELGLSDPGLWRIVRVDGQGRRVISSQSNGASCGRYLQVLDLSCCHTSNVEQVPLP